MYSGLKLMPSELGSSGSPWAQTHTSCWALNEVFTL